MENDNDRQHFVLCEISNELKRIADALTRMATPVLTFPIPQPVPYNQPYQPYASPTVAPLLPTYTCSSEEIAAEIQKTFAAEIQKTWGGDPR